MVNVPGQEGAEERFFRTMQVLGPHIKKVAENEQRKGIAAFRILMLIAQNMSIDVKKVFESVGYDPLMGPITVDEMEKAAKEAGYKTVQDFMEDGQDGENIKRAREMGYLPKEQGSL